MACFPEKYQQKYQQKEKCLPLACTAIERKTQPKAAWIWKIVLHPPLHRRKEKRACYYFHSGKPLSVLVGRE